jgi:hypothetical protein
MTTIIGIAGKKQSGKNTSANFFHGKTMKEIGSVQDFQLNEKGQLIIQTSDSSGRIGWGEFDVTRKDDTFIEYAEQNLWPYVKLYSFADSLKQICMDLFDVPYECLYGTDEQKNQIQEHLLWENMPGVYTDEDMYQLSCEANPCLAEVLIFHNAGPMTAREFMQFFGTEIMRKIWSPVWVKNTMKRIKREKSKLAIIADVRFPNEVNSILEESGYVIKLNRNSDVDSHTSEKSIDPENFDQSKFTKIIDNIGEIQDLCNELDKFYTTI